MKTFVWVVVIILIIIGGWWFLARPASAPSTDSTNNMDMTATSSTPANNTTNDNQTDSTIPDVNVNTSVKTSTDLPPLVIKMDSGAFYFHPDMIKAKLGQKVQIAITSKGRHNFAIDELNVNVNTPNGETTTVEFVASKKGTFQFYCNIPGHRQSGQVGTLIVE